MSTNAISASNQTSLAALFGAAKESPRQGDRGNGASFGERQDQGVTVLASLLQALIQAAGTQPAAATTPGASAAATTVTTATTATASSPPTTGTGSAASTSTSSAPSASTLVQDLQAFLHDLIHALRQTGHTHRHDDDDAKPPVPTTPVNTGSSTSTATTSTPGATTTAAATTASANTGVAAYGQRGIIASLLALVKDLGNSQVIGDTGSSTSLSSNVLSSLNSAFEKLIGDLNGGRTNVASTANAASSANAAGSANGGTSSGSASGSAQSTAALQSFLTNFVQDLQNNGANSLSPLGSSVNTTA